MNGAALVVVGKRLSLALVLGALTFLSVQCLTKAKSPVSTSRAFPLGRQFSIAYYDLDGAEDVSAVEQSTTRTDRTVEIERLLFALGVSNNLIEPYAIVFSSSQLLQDVREGSVAPAIVRDGSPVAMPTVPVGATGCFSEQARIIWLNSAYSAADVRWIFIHELGHLVGTQLDPNEFGQFMRLRKMPPAMADSWFGYLGAERRHAGASLSLGESASKSNLEKPLYLDVWKLSPSEDFAEVFRLLLKPWYVEEHWEVTTYFGAPSDAVRAWFDYTVRPRLRR